MDTQRTLLFVALSFVIFMIWQVWQQEHQIVTNTSTNTNNVTSNNAIVTKPNTSKVVSNLIPSVNSNKDTSISTPNVAEVISGDISVYTDVFNIKLANKGGKIVHLDLIKYPVNVEDKTKFFSLLQSKSPNKPFYVCESGIKGPSNLDSKLFPDHNALFSGTKSEYTLSGDTLEVPLTWKSLVSGLEITKTYIFTKNSYDIKVIYTINNQTGSEWRGSVYGQLTREGLLKSEERGLTNYSYTGAAYYTKENKYEKVDFENLDEKAISVSSKNTWIGFIQHYFTGAIIPTKEEVRLYSYKEANHYSVGALQPLLVVKAGETKESSFNMFLGPKLQDQMQSSSEGLELSVDYTWLTIVAKPIFWLLKTIYSFVQNWGISIILVTLFIKLIFFKLSATSYKSMARMRKLQPRLAKMKENFGDDKMALNKAMMKMYKDEKVNPMGGCLPVLVQVPVFIALYWVLLETVELRQASFLWLSDLSIPDSFYILPVLMGVSMFIQQKLNGKPADPIQAKVMTFLPFVFTIFFIFFPAGLVLYWVANNVFSIAQQWYITKQINS